jgi:hypothetical protein
MAFHCIEEARQEDANLHCIEMALINSFGDRNDIPNHLWIMVGFLSVTCIVAKKYLR